MIDPCMGSGHILCYMFDVLVQIYEAYGYTAREAASMIVRNNLWGLDIDDRAAQLAYFAVMMKARQYDRRFFTRDVQPHVFAIQESNSINLSVLMMNDAEKKAAKLLVNAFHDAKEYGSILTMSDELLAAVDALPADAFAWEGTFFAHEGELLTQLCFQARALGQKYHAVITNPPYMAITNASRILFDYVKKNLMYSTADLFGVFIERCSFMLKEHGLYSMITQHSWMFLSSFEKLRTYLTTLQLVNMAHLGPRAFEEISGEVVQTTAFVIQNSICSRYLGTSRPAIVRKRDNMDEYDVIFVGFPIWWYVAPHIINSFMETYNFAGKTIVPFATSGGSDMGKTNEALAPSCPGAKLAEGKVLNGKQLNAWVDSLKL